MVSLIVKCTSERRRDRERYFHGPSRPGPGRPASAARRSPGPPASPVGWVGWCRRSAMDGGTRDDRCSEFTAHCLLAGVRYLLYTIHSPPFSTLSSDHHCPLSVIFWLMPTVFCPLPRYHPPFHRPPSTVHRPPSTVHRPRLTNPAHMMYC